VSVPGRFVVGVDGSECSRRALDWAVDVAQALGSEVVAVHALGLLTHLAGVEVPSQSHREEVRTAFENQWCAPLRASTVSQICLLVDGNPVTALLTAADEYRADAIVVGSRGNGGFPGLQLGSTSHQLVQHSDKPVVIIPDATGRAAAPERPPPP